MLNVLEPPLQERPNKTKGNSRKASHPFGRDTASSKAYTTSDRAVYDSGRHITCELGEMAEDDVTLEKSVKESKNVI